MTISSQTRKAGPYNGNGLTTTFPFAFKVFQASDVLVVRANASGVETVLTLGTDYTVSLNSNQDSNAGGNVVMATAPASGYTLTIGSQVPLLQQTDFTNQGGFYPKVLNASMDKLTIITQQLQEEVNRSAKLPISNAADADTLTAAILQVANDQANIDAVAGDLANIDSVKNNKTNIDTVAGISANVTTVAGIAANVTSVAGNATNINTVAGNNTNVTTVAGISANVTTVANNSSNVTTVASNISAVNTNASNITAIQNASTNATNAANSATAASTSATNASTSATAAAASAAAAAAAAASGLYSTVQDKSANYTIVAADAGDLIRVSTGSGAVTITLPSIAGAGIGDGFKIAVVKWTSDSNQVTVQRAGSDTINGATSATIGSQYSQIIFVADGETNTWFASQSGLGATNVNVDTFSGNGSTTSFTMSVDPSSKNNTRVHIGGVYQQKSTYSVSGTTLTFSTAPVSGTSNIEVEYATPLAIGTPSDGTVTTAKLVDSNVTTAKIADSNVTTAKIADSNVTRAKLASATLGNMAGVVPIGSNTTLTSADAGKLFPITAASLSIQINTSGLSLGDRFMFIGNGGSATITRTDSGNFVGFGVTTVSSMSLASGEGISFFWDGTTLIVENFSLNNKYSTSFASSLSSSACYQKLPSGLIIQAGYTTVGANTTLTVTLPLTFPSSFVSIVAIHGGFGDWQGYTGYTSGPGGCVPISNSQFNISSKDDASGTFYWMAIGY